MFLNEYVLSELFGLFLGIQSMISWVEKKLKV